MKKHGGKVEAELRERNALLEQQLAAKEEQLAAKEERSRSSATSCWRSRRSSSRPRSGRTATPRWLPLGAP